MLFLSCPTEIQSHILSFLPRRDLATAVRVSQHLQAVAIRLLYVRVVLRTWEHIDAFFLCGSLITPGSVPATKHAEARRQHWDHIKTLFIAPSYDTRHPTCIPPRSLEARGSHRLQIETLSLATDVDKRLLPLLACLSPKNLVAALDHNTPVLATALNAPEWTSLRNLRTWMSRGDAHMYNLGPPLYNIKYVIVKLICPYRNEHRGAGEDVVAFATSYFPSATRMKFIVSTQQRKTALEAALKDGLGGKPADFFTIEVRP